MAVFSNLKAKRLFWALRQRLFTAAGNDSSSPSTVPDMISTQIPVFMKAPFQKWPLLFSSWNCEAALLFWEACTDEAPTDSWPSMCRGTGGSTVKSLNSNHNHPGEGQHSNDAEFSPWVFALIRITYWWLRYNLLSCNFLHMHLLQNTGTAHSVS